MWSLPPSSNTRSVHHWLEYHYLFSKDVFFSKSIDRLIGKFVVMGRHHTLLTQSSERHRSRSASRRMGRHIESNSEDGITTQDYTIRIESILSDSQSIEEGHIACCIYDDVRVRGK